MKHSFSLFAVAATLVSSGAFAADWEKPELLAVKKICGTVVKTKTMYDGVQSVFSETDKRGKAIQTYYLNAVGKPAEAVLEALKADESKAVCVVGTPSSLPSGAILVDSPNSFLTLQIVQ